MKISPSVWTALKLAAERNDQQTFEQLVLALADQAIRDERGRQAARQPTDQPFLASCR